MIGNHTLPNVTLSDLERTNSRFLALLEKYQPEIIAWGPMATLFVMRTTT